MKYITLINRSGKRLFIRAENVKPGRQVTVPSDTKYNTSEWELVEEKKKEEIVVKKIIKKKKKEDDLE